MEAMEIRYQFFEEEHLLIQKFFGLFSHEFYTQNIGKIYNKLQGKEIKIVLIDFRDIIIHEKEDTAPIDFSEKLDKIIQFRSEINRKELGNKEVTLIFWVDKPFPTVIADIFVRNFSGKNYHYCSSEEKVCEIAKLSLEFSLSDKISKLNSMI